MRGENDGRVLCRRRSFGLVPLHCPEVLRGYLRSRGFWPRRDRGFWAMELVICLMGFRTDSGWIQGNTSGQGNEGVQEK